MSRIYLIHGDDRLVPMDEQGYISEDRLQELLARYPDLLAGDQPSSESPRRWLLISREVGVPDEQDGPDRWALDHLFLDQEAIPTLIEVKRSSDTRIRREVVGQMLDYAANAAIYWPIERIRREFEERHANHTDLIAQLLGSDADEDLFWRQVEDNLRARKMRLFFVADEIPRELRRIIEFLNDEMDSVQVLGLEVRQYVGEGVRSLVPRVVGQTAAAQQAKSAQATHQWDEETFFVELERRRGADETAAVRGLLNWVRDKKLSVEWGKGSVYGSFFPAFDHKGKRHSPVVVWTNGYLEIRFDNMSSRPPFDREEKRREFARLLSAIPGIEFAADRVEGHPNFRLSPLTEADDLARLLSALDWFVEEVKKS